MRGKLIALFVGLVVVAVATMVAVGPLKPVLSALGSIIGSANIAACPTAQPVKVGTITVPPGPVAGYCQDQLVNAAHIINAARNLGIGTHTQTIGVMTAMGESKLRNLAHGDAAGLDSRGIFQQRDNGAWGTLADRMDPYTAAHNFFAKLVSLPNWQTLSPTEAAHAVQVNADANYYSKYWSDAQKVVAVLSGK